MEYRVEELATAAGVGVDTVRFYQGRGLLRAPRRQGRRAFYGDDHLERLKRIRDLQRQGFTLAQIERVLSEQTGEGPGPLLAALVAEGVGERTLSRRELAAEAGVPEVLIRSAQSAGLLEPVMVDGEERFAEADVEMARTGLAILETGFSMQTLLGHAIGHARHVNKLCDAAIELFDDGVRKSGPSAGDDEAITEAFRRLLPQVTRLVALHFQRTLVSRALNRLKGKDEQDALRAALAATESARLEVRVDWR